MSMMRGLLAVSGLLSCLAFGACSGGSDYQGGGRRTDLGSGTDGSIALTSGGDQNAAGSAGSGGASTAGGAGRAGYAGCGTSDDGGQGFATDCTP